MSSGHYSYIQNDYKNDIDIIKASIKCSSTNLRHIQTEYSHNYEFIIECLQDTPIFISDLPIKFRYNINIIYENIKRMNEYYNYTCLKSYNTTLIRANLLHYLKTYISPYLIGITSKFESYDEVLFVLEDLVQRVNKGNKILRWHKDISFLFV